MIAREAAIGAMEEELGAQALTENAEAPSVIVEDYHDKPNAGHLCRTESGPKYLSESDVLYRCGSDRHTRQRGQACRELL